MRIIETRVLSPGCKALRGQKTPYDNIIVQAVEYTVSSFTISDSIYGSSFYFGTGFHGFPLHISFFNCNNNYTSTFSINTPGRRSWLTGASLYMPINLKNKVLYSSPALSLNKLEMLAQEFSPY
jgi:hypothetical protein